ncbi:MAG TPA: MFS transporter [Gaiellaceae bacterium]|nr:MFS transporter [Gaiellaceae bacterium]
MRARIFAEENRKWLTLASVSFGLFMIMLDNTVVNVALPSIQRDLGADLSELEWIVTGYALTFASLMLVGGKLADAYGRRLVFVAGIVVFTTASLFCGLASSADMLIGSRVLQGAGAALMNPATLSIIAATFPPRERGTAIGIWAGTSALALAIGPLVGGLITEHANWNWIFFINLPIGLLGIVASFVFIDETRDETHERLDLPGLVTSALGLFALTYGLIEANTYGWGSTRIIGAFVLAGAALLAFVVLERHQRAPMLPLELFRNRTFTGANLTMLLVALAMFGVFFFVSLYMQNILGYSAVQAGAAFLPMTLLIIVVAPMAGKASDRLGSRGLMTAGMILLSVQLLLFSRLSADASFWNLLPALLIGGVGMACTMTPSAAAATRSVPVDKAGVGSAVLNSARQVGGTMGIAVMGAIMAAEAGGERTPAAFMDGFQAALTVAAAIALLGAVVAFLLVRPHEGAGEHRRGSAAAEPAA